MQPLAAAIVLIAHCHHLRQPLLGTALAKLHDKPHRPPPQPLQATSAEVLFSTMGQCVVLHSRATLKGNIIFTCYDGASRLVSMTHLLGLGGEQSAATDLGQDSNCIWRGQLQVIRQVAALR
jgi:hypothetical protein